MLGTKFKTSALIFGLTISAALPALAAEPELYFYPAKAWMTGPAMTSASMSGGQDCAVQSEFNNGFVVRFEGSSRFVENMSVNFRQDIFTTGQSYPVMLAAPGGTRQSLSATAVSPMILNIRLQGQRDIYRAMRDSGVMDLSVDQNDFRFYLVGFASAAKQFEQCMAGGASVNAPQNAPSAMKEAAAISTDMRVNESIAFEQKETAKIEDIQKVAVKEIIPEPAKPPITQVDLKAADKTEPTNDMSGQFFAETPAMNDTPPAPAPALAAMKEEPKEEVFFTTPRQVPVPTIPAETENAARPVKKVEVPAPARAKIHKEVYSMEADLTKLGEVEPAANTPFEDSESREFGRRISELESKLRAVQKENGSLRDELETTLSEGQQEHLDISSKNWNLERATMRYNEAERQIKKLGSDLQKERAQCSVEKKELENMLFDPQVTSQEQLAKLAEMEEQLMKAHQELQDQRQQYEARIRMLEGKTSQ